MTATPSVVNTFASVRQLSSDNGFFGGEVFNGMAYEVRMRYRKDLNQSVSTVMTRDYRLKWNGFVLNITGVVDTLNKGNWEVIITATRKA